MIEQSKNHKNNDKSFDIKRKQRKNSYIYSSSKSYLYPIIFILSILPLIVRRKAYQSNLIDYKWFASTETLTDYFLYYKQWLFILTIFIMVVIIMNKYFKNREYHLFIPYFIPLYIYASMALLSSVFTKYRAHSFTGVHGQFESVFVLIGYCVVVYYINIFVKSDRDLELIIKSLVFGSLILGVLGITQITGRDFFSSDIGKRLITPTSQWENIKNISFVFEENRVYLSFFNPNYVGTYVALVLPVLIILSLFVKNKKYKLPLYILSIVGLVISLIGSKSSSGIVGILFGLLLSMILLWRYLVKYYYVSIPMILVLVIFIFIFNGQTHYFSNQLNKFTNFHKSEPSLKAIETNDIDLTVNYKDNIMKIIFVAENNYGYFVILDGLDQLIPTTYNPETGITSVVDERFPEFSLNPIYYDEVLSFQVNIDGFTWNFTNQTDGTYYLINQFGRFDKIVPAPSALLTGYEGFATGRGYIWSRTLPLLKKHIFLGSGADTFIFEFPQADYVNLYNYGFSNMITTKPHSMYLQIGVQTGIISLISFLVFYMIYFISSVKLYIKARFQNNYEIIGVAITIGTFSYMIATIANDSSIAVAPVFWTLIGLGIVANSNVKRLLNTDETE